MYSLGHSTLVVIILHRWYKAADCSTWAQNMDTQHNPSSSTQLFVFQFLVRGFCQPLHRFKYQLDFEHAMCIQYNCTDCKLDDQSLMALHSWYLLFIVFGLNPSWAIYIAVGLVNLASVWIPRTYNGKWIHDGVVRNHGIALRKLNGRTKISRPQAKINWIIIHTSTIELCLKRVDTFASI